MNFKDDKLTEEELKEVKAGIVSGKVDESLDLMGTKELKYKKTLLIICNDYVISWLQTW